MSPITALSLLLMAQVSVEQPPEPGKLQATLDAAYAQRPTLKALRALK